MLWPEHAPMGLNSLSRNKVGHVEVSPGDRLSYRTLIRPEDPDC